MGAVQDHVDDVIGSLFEDCPDPADMADMIRTAVSGFEPPRYIARFSPQAWVNDYAIEVDPEGPTEWDATEGVAGMPDGYRDGLLVELETNDEARDDDDWLQRHDLNAPDWVRDWSGPFDIYLRVER